MKKLAVVILALVLLLLAGCNTAPIEWKVSDDLGNGLFALSPEIEQTEHDWYCVADTESGGILSVGLIYPQSYGAPAEAECKVGGKKTTCETESWDRDGGGVLFYILSTEDFDLDSTKKIKIIQNFENKTVTIEFIPERVKVALDKE